MEEIKAIVMALEGVRLAVIASRAETRSEYANSVVQSDRAMRMAQECLQRAETSAKAMAEDDVADKPKEEIEKPTPIKRG